MKINIQDTYNTVYSASSLQCQVLNRKFTHHTLEETKTTASLSHPVCKRAEHAISSYSRGEEAATRPACLQKQPVGLKLQAEIMLTWNWKERGGNQAYMRPERQNAFVF